MTRTHNYKNTKISLKESVDIIKYKNYIWNVKHDLSKNTMIHIIWLNGFVIIYTSLKAIFSDFLLMLDNTILPCPHFVYISLQTNIVVVPVGNTARTDSHKWPTATTYQIWYYYCVISLCFEFWKKSLKCGIIRCDYIL